MDRKASKRAKIDNAAESIVSKLPRLRRQKLEAIAEAAIRSSSAAVLAAAESLQDTSTSGGTFLRHCVRCHEDFDPDTAGYADCVMEEHDENNGMIEVGRSGREFIYPCCHQGDDAGQPCWTGPHITSWSKAPLVKGGKDWTYDPFNKHGFWLDQDMAPKWRTYRKKGGSKASQCFECDYREGFCEDCCTCGKAGLD